MLTKTDIENYFNAVKHEHLFVLIIAAVAIMLAAYFYFGIKKGFYKGLAISLISFAMLFITTSFSEYKKADRLRVVNTYNYDLHPERLKSKELPRLVNEKKYDIIKTVILIALLVSSILLYFYSNKLKHAAYLQGIAIGAITMTCIAITTLLFDINLIKNYSKAIEIFSKEFYV